MRVLGWVFQGVRGVLRGEGERGGSIRGGGTIIRALRVVASFGHQVQGSPSHISPLSTVSTTFSGSTFYFL